MPLLGENLGAQQQQGKAIAFDFLITDGLADFARETLKSGAALANVQIISRFLYYIIAVL